jgi:hypothetical protein
MRKQTGIEILGLVADELRAEKQNFEVWIQNGGAVTFSNLPEVVQTMIVRGVCETRDQINRYEFMMEGK